MVETLPVAPNDPPRVQAGVGAVQVKTVGVGEEARAKPVKNGRTKL